MITFEGLNNSMEIVQLHDKKFEKFISYQRIQESIAEVSDQINRDYVGKSPVFVGVLNGSFLFSADLIKQYNGECEVAFVRLSSYQGTVSSGKVSQLLGLSIDLKKRDVIILEDIVDTGNTFHEILKIVNAQSPNSVKIATLLFKPDAYKQKYSVDYVALSVTNEFLVGYGLDYDGSGRNLKDIYKIIE